MMEFDIEKIKNQIKELIEHNYYKEAIKFLQVLIEEIPECIEFYSMYVVSLTMKGDIRKAIDIAKKGLAIDLYNFDLLYNLAYLYMNNNELSKALTMYEDALSYCNEIEIQENIKEIIRSLECEYNIEKAKKVVFFSKPGMDSFLKDIIKGLDSEFICIKMEVSANRSIDIGMEWADICWFEWCDELIVYGSKNYLANEKKIICRLHRYEAFTNYPENVVWENVDKLIIVTDHIKGLLVKKIPKIEESVDIITIFNGVDMAKYKLKERKYGFNIAYVGYIHSRKNPTLLLQIIDKLVKIDKKYKLYIAGEFQDSLIELYFNYQIEQMGLQENVVFEGWQDNIDEWLQDKNYILSTSIHESFGYGIAEAMSRGIKPIIHNFIFSKEIWGENYTFNTVDEAINMITDMNYNSNEYRKFIEENYSLEIQIEKIKTTLIEISSENNVLEKNLGDYIKRTRTKLSESLGFQKIKELTMVIPTYNRAKILEDDLKKGYKLGDQTKIIVDDYSDKNHRKTLNDLNGFKGIQKIIFHNENKGVAASVNTAVNFVKTKYVTFLGDDDIILSYDDKEYNENLKLLDINYNIIIPRYIVNLDPENKLSPGYDRGEFDGVTSSEILKNIFFTGEMYVFNAGAIYTKENVEKSLPNEIFRVSEDYVMLARILASNPYKKIKVSEDYIYVRRISNDTLSKTINFEKLSLHLLSLLISGYYCLKNRILTIDEVINAIRQRGEVLQKLYGYGVDFSEIIIMYIRNELELNELLEIIRKRDFIKNLTVENMPKEMIEIKEWILTNEVRFL
jgi:glycosyltransferase involved in cell wall biosynthesis